MCWCRPEIRTPNCGRLECHPPIESKQEGKCDKCGGAGWVWWFELDEYSGPAVETGSDDTKYTCDRCTRGYYK